MTLTLVGGFYGRGGGRKVAVAAWKLSVMQAEVFCDERRMGAGFFGGVSSWRMIAVA